MSPPGTSPPPLAAGAIKLQERGDMLLVTRDLSAALSLDKLPTLMNAAL
jgi:hypothetical protein